MDIGELQPGSLVAGRYRIDRLLGRGGMGSIWHAVDETLDREVAIKCLHVDGQSHADHLIARERVLREARIAARLHHPNVVTIFDIIERDEPWLILEYVPSRNLAEILAEQGTLTPEKAAAIGAQIAAALVVAHRAEIVHRDIKPANILVATESTEDAPDIVAKLTDFGISHAATGSTLTATGLLTGTPAYFAPETAVGGGTDARTDLYSLGATLYTATEGEPPFGKDTENILALLARIGRGGAPPPRNAGPLTDLLRRLLDDDPAARPSATETYRTLQAVQTDVPAPLVPVASLEPSEEAGAGPTIIGPVAPATEVVAPPSTAVAARRLLSRTAPGLLAGALVISVTAVGINALAESPPPSAAAQQITIDNPKRADPCSLINLTALDRYGPAQLRVSDSAFPECRVSIGDSADLSLSLETPSLLAPEEFQLEQVGSLHVGRRPADDESCQRQILLNGGGMALITVTDLAELSDKEMCEIAESATAEAVDILVKDGVGTSDALVGHALTGVPACDLLQLSEITDAMDEALRTPEEGFADWSCSWGGSDEVVTLEFRQRPAGRSAEGVPTDFNGRKGTLRLMTNSCRADVDQSIHGGVTVDFVRIQVNRSEPESLLCWRATELAGLVAARLPT